MTAPTATVLAATPDRRRRPSDGLVVEASILARLLRVRLLRLEATVVIVPAEVTARPSAPPDVQGRPSARSARPLPEGSATSGRRGLAEAVRTLDEGAAILAEARRTASSGRASRNGGTRRRA
jgi:hypothetical protein